MMVIKAMWKTGRPKKQIMDLLDRLEKPTADQINPTISSSRNIDSGLDYSVQKIGRIFR